MANSPRLGWPYPDKDQDPFYDTFVSMVTAIDSSVYATREDRQTIFWGGGTVSFSAPTLTWTSPFNILAGPTGFQWNIAAGSISVTEGSVIWVNLNRAPTQNTTLTLNVGVQVPATDNALVIGVCSGSNFYFRNGMAIASGSIGINPPAIPTSLVTSKGDLIAGTGAGSVSRLPVSGTNGMVLQADSTATTGLSWVAQNTSGVPESTVTAKGDILVATSSGVVGRLPVGADSNVLFADSVTATGLSWGAVPGVVHLSPGSADVGNIDITGTATVGAVTSSGLIIADSGIQVGSTSNSLISESGGSITAIANVASPISSSAALTVDTYGSLWGSGNLLAIKNNGTTKASIDHTGLGTFNTLSTTGATVNGLLAAQSITATTGAATITGTIITDGYFTTTAGSVIGVTSLDSSGTIQGLRLTDGHFSVTGGNITGAGSIVASGSITGVTSIAASGHITTSDGSGFTTNGVNGSVEAKYFHADGSISGTVAIPGISATGAPRGPGVYAISGSSTWRGSLTLFPQTTPSAPYNGDVWVDTTPTSSGNFSVHMGGNTYVVGGNPFASCYCSVATTLTSATFTPINFNTITVDTDSAITTGASWKYTVPVGKGGTYMVTGAISPANAGSLGSNPLQLNILIGGSPITPVLYFNSGITMTSLVSGGVYIPVVQMLQLADGNQLSIGAKITSTGATISGYLQIKRIGD